MADDYTEIDDRLQKWMAQQHMFFVATAPSSDGGLVNCSPKGLDSLRVLGPKELAYVDTGGSGIETLAHLKENGRIVLMMCAFDGPPRIMRFYGTGTPIEPHDDAFDDLLAKFPAMPAARNIIRIEVDRIMKSCGYGVPLYDYKEQRESIPNYFNNQSDDEILAYRRNRNSASLDGLPGLTFPGDAE